MTRLWGPTPPSVHPALLSTSLPSLFSSLLLPQLISLSALSTVIPTCPSFLFPLSPILAIPQSFLPSFLLSSIFFPPSYLPLFSSLSFFHVHPSLLVIFPSSISLLSLSLPCFYPPLLYFINLQCFLSSYTSYSLTSFTLLCFIVSFLLHLISCLITLSTPYDPYLSPFLFP